jgi:predicted DCC family thiol-disulfide oxidoreductase YuxK
MSITRLWSRAFLERRPSTSLGLFRLAVAWTVGCHMIPSFFHMGDNYLSTAFRTKNFSFFPVWILRLVEASPDWVVWAFTALFFIAWFAFTAGFASQLSAILMTLTCYYFYALNNYHIGTLSFDILLVTLFLMCVTGYHGDFLSLDSLRRGDVRSYKRLRPFFIQRLLQLQLVWTFWYTALSKMTGGGNWLTDNPYYALMHYPPIGVVRDFPLRDWLEQQPGACHALGVALIVFECAIPFLWFIRRTRPIGIVLGVAFQVMLWVTLHVPTIFLFLFPPMMLLFIEPERLVQWIESRQAAHAARGRAVLLYDGQCGFCVESVKRLRVLDLFGWVDPLDFHRQPELATLHPALTPQRCRSEMVLLEPNGRLSGGFAAFRRLTRHLPLLCALAPLVRVPGASWIGTRLYRWIAAHRYLLHRNPACRTNQCSLPGGMDVSSN